MAMFTKNLRVLRNIPASRQASHFTANKVNDEMLKNWLYENKFDHVNDVGASAYHHSTFPLKSAAEQGNMDMAYSLILAGAEVNYRNESTFTALGELLCFWASNARFIMHEDLIDFLLLLIGYGADVNAEFIGKTTHLHFVATHWYLPGAENIFEILVANGANIYARDEEEMTPFCLAKNRGNRKYFGPQMRE